MALLERADPADSAPSPSQESTRAVAAAHQVAGQMLHERILAAAAVGDFSEEAAAPTGTHQAWLVVSRGAIPRPAPAAAVAHLM